MEAELLTGWSIRRELPAPVRDLLLRIEFNGTDQSEHDLALLTTVLEALEAMYESVVGDAQLAGSPRSQYEIGDLLYNMKEYQTTLLAITEVWIMSETGSIEKRVSALRFCLALTRCWGFGEPLDQVSMVERLQGLVESGWDDQDVEIKDEAALLKVQQTVYSIGLLAIALSSPEVAGEAVRCNLLPKFIRYLRSTLTEQDQSNSFPGGRQVRGAEDMATLLMLRPDNKSWEEISWRMANSKQKCCIQYVARLGEYLDSLGPLLQAHGVEVVLGLLRRGGRGSDNITDVLHMVAALLAHRRFAEVFIEQGGVQLLLSIPRVLTTQAGIAQCLHGLASVPLAFERVCSFPDSIVAEVAGVALSILKSGALPGALKFSVLFLGSAIAYPAMQKAFDSAQGLKPLLSVIRSTVMMIREESTVELKTEKQVVFYATYAIRQYFRMHFTLNMIQLRKKMHSSQSQQVVWPSRYKAVDLSQEIVEKHLETLESEAKLFLPFIQTGWAPRELFCECGGVGLFFELVQIAPGERYYHDTTVHALEVLYIVGLSPFSRVHIFSAKGGLVEGGTQDGMTILLNAISEGTPCDYPEVMQSVLLVLNKCLSPVASLANMLPPSGKTRHGSSHQPRASQTTRAVTPRPSSSRGAQESENTLGHRLEASFANARKYLRSRNGIKVLLSLLQERTLISQAYVYKIRALACQCLLGLSRDHTIRLILSRLQIGRVLAELVREPQTVVYQRSGTTGAPGGRQLGMAGCLGSNMNNAHLLFSKVALELIALTTGQGIAGRPGTAAASDAAAPALHKIERAAVAASTKLTYPSDELLKLIYEHLKLTGLHKAAGALAAESGLGRQMQQMLGKGPPGTKHTSGSANGGLHRRKSLRNVTDSVRENNAADEPVHDDVHVRRSPTRRGLKRTLSSVLSPNHGETGSGRKAVRVSSTPNSDERESQMLVDRSPTPQLATAGHLRISPAGKLPSDGRSEVGPGQNGVMKPDQDHSQESSSNDVSRYLNPYLVCLPSAASGGKRKTVKFEREDGMDRSIPIHTSACISNFTSGPPAGSKLNGIVMNYLKHQHWQACMQCPTPVSVLPPVSLLRPHSLPEAKRPLDASTNVVRRHTMAQMGFPHGGWGGAQLTRHQIFSKFHCKMSLREDGDLFSCCSHVKGLGALVVGTSNGNLRVYDSAWDVPEGYSAHMSRVFMTDVPKTPSTLLASSSRDEVRIWNVAQMDEGSVHSFEGVRSGRFNTSGSQIACIGNMIREMKVALYDVATGQEVVVLGGTQGGDATSSRSFNGVSFSPSDELLVWCNTLWDPRAPKAIHTFDVFTDNHGGCFKPDGLELIMNSEIWDLRTFQLLKSVSILDGTRVQFNETGDVMYAVMQRTLGDYATLSSTRRLGYSLYAAFRTLNAQDYQEIATVAVERAVMDLALDTTDETVSVVTFDVGDVLNSAVRVYTIGRGKHGDEDSDIEEESTDDGEESDGENVDDESAEIVNGGWDDSGSESGSHIESFVSGDESEGSGLNGLGIFSDYEEDEDQDFTEEMAAMLLNQMGDEDLDGSDYFGDDD